MRIVVFAIRQIGLDPLNFLGFIKYSPRFLKTLFKYCIQNDFRRIKISPVFNDFGSEGGTASGHYFWQDLLCAKWIFESDVENHLDIGSRVDGFIAHLLTFREVEILDIRPVYSKVPNLKIHRGDAQSTLRKFESNYQSVSSLHAIEHFGLGRYGDEIDPEGHRKGLSNIAACVKISGNFYISFPIGKPVVEFNSQRILHPNWPIEELPNFELIDFVLIPWKAEPIFNILPSEVDLNEPGQAGLYKFKRSF